MRGGTAVSTAALAVAALALAPGIAPAQSCGIVSGVSAAGGAVHHRVGGGTSGYTVGGDVAFPAGPAAVAVGYRHTLLEGEAADPDIARVRAAFPALDLGGVDLCVVADGGVTRFTLGDDAGAVLAGGAGLALAPSYPWPVQPYITVRGLGARTTGTVLGFDVEASGLSLGVEGGITAAFGPVTARLAGSLDGFDGGLGVTPYPTRMVELGLGLRF